MKSALTVMAALMAVIFFASASFAEDSKVSTDALSALGLGGLQEMSDVEGTQVRGRYTITSMVIGTSTVSFQFTTPDTKNFVTGSSVNMVQGADTVMASLSNPLPTISKLHGVSVDGGLVDDGMGNLVLAPLSFQVQTAGPPATFFLGQIFGGLGGAGSIAGAP